MYGVDPAQGHCRTWPSFKSCQRRMETVALINGVSVYFLMFCSSPSGNRHTLAGLPRGIGDARDCGYRRDSNTCAWAVMGRHWRSVRPVHSG